MASGTQYNIMGYICQWFSLGTPISSTNKTDRHDITEILLKVVLSTIPLTLYFTPNTETGFFVNVLFQFETTNVH